MASTEGALESACSQKQDKQAQRSSGLSWLRKAAEQEDRAAAYELHRQLLLPLLDSDDAKKNTLLAAAPDLGAEMRAIPGVNAKEAEAWGLEAARLGHPAALYEAGLRTVDCLHLSSFASSTS